MVEISKTNFFSPRNSANPIFPHTHANPITQPTLGSVQTQFSLVPLQTGANQITEQTCVPLKDFPGYLFTILPFSKQQELANPSYPYTLLMYSQQFERSISLPHTQNSRTLRTLQTQFFLVPLKTQ